MPRQGGGGVACLGLLLIVLLSLVSSAPAHAQTSCGKNDVKCWEVLAKQQADLAAAAWGKDGQCRNGVGPGCSPPQPPPPQQKMQAKNAQDPRNAQQQEPPVDPMQDAAKRAAQNAKELHDKEFQRVRDESAQTGGGGGGGDQEVLQELNRRAKTAGEGATKPYDVLGVPASATRSEIKKAYRKLSLMLHPDKIKDSKLKETANTVFMDIVAAYEVLGNEDKRQAFDDLGDADGAKKETFNTYWEYQKYGNKKTKENNDFFNGHPLIANLHSSYWDRRVTGSSIWIVDFYAPWCGHCVDMVPGFKQLAKALENHDTLQVGAVNCEKDKKFCQGIGVQGYPTLALFTSNDAGLVEFFPRGMAKSPEKIEKWARDKAEEWRWLLESGPPTPLTQHTFNKNVMESEDSWVVLYLQNKQSNDGKDARTHALSLSAEVRGFAKVGVIDCANEAQLCYNLHGVKRNDKGELRYFRSGSKVCSGVNYLGEHIVNLADVSVRDALMMTARLLRILGASASDPCGEIAADGTGKASWEKGQPPKDEQRASWSGGNQHQQQRQFRGPMVGGGGGRRVGIGR